MRQVTYCTRSECTIPTKKPHRKYCSRQCYDLARIRAVPLVEKTCEAVSCKETTVNPRFCSKRCAVATLNHEQPKRKRIRVTVHCSMCGRERWVASATTPHLPICFKCLQTPEAFAERLKTRRSPPGKDQLYELGFKKPECEWCGLTEWRGVDPVPLTLDHIDGNTSHNWIENLRILCGNCHLQTPTYGGANKGRPFSVERG